MSVLNILQSICIVCILMYIKGSQSFPQISLVTTTSLPVTTQGNTPSRQVSTTTLPKTPQPPPKIVDVDIKSDIQLRYAKTVVKTYIKNPSLLISQEVEFNMVLPDKAFISNFTIQVKDNVYVAEVEKKEEAKELYDQAVQDGQSAGIVDTDIRDANKITIKSNLEAASKMLFTLTYEELLERHISKYEHIIHVNPGQIVKNFNVNVKINESLPIKNINVPELKTDANEITSQLLDNTIAKIERNVNGQPNRAHIQFQPTPDDQRRMAKLSKREEDGMVGQFIVQYDVDRHTQGNEIQVLDGYFVHFFAPDELEVMPRHVVFVLDLSGSMRGVKLEQTKDAMVTILDDMSDRDHFNILTFSDDVLHWVPKEYRENVTEIESLGPTNSTYQGTDSIRKEALKYVLDLGTRGGTNINDGLLEAVKLVENVKVSEAIPYNVKPIIIFLTDGQATSGETNRKSIRKNVLNQNQDLNVPIYGLAFGNGADFDLIKGIGLESDAFARKIFEASDAAIQLEDFYAEIASPLLSNVTFDYVGQSFQNKTSKKANTFFKGGEFVVAGKLDNTREDVDLEIIVRGTGRSSDYKKVIRHCIPIHRPYELKDNESVDDSKAQNVSFRPPKRGGCLPWPLPPLPSPIPQKPKSESENFIERLWSFLTIKNLLNENNKDEEEVSEFKEGTIDEKLTTQQPISKNVTKKTNKEKALELALKYNFVTKLTSLYVIKPDDGDVQTQKNSSKTAVNPVPISLTSPNNRNRFSPLSSFASFKGSSSLSHGNIGSSLLSSHRIAGGIRKSANRNRLSHRRPSPTIKDTGSFGGFRRRTTTITTRTTATTTTIDLNGAQCSLSMFSKTYLRGQSITLSNPNNTMVSNLTQVSFDNELASLKVEGPCCWKLFEDHNYTGQSKIFSEGEYKSSSKLGSALTKDASSVLLMAC